MTQVDGVVVIDKPAGWTSHDVVAKCRGILGTRKIGHAGTLDPSATGVLVCGVGTATRLLRFIQDTTKEYVGEVVFGTTTSTLDSDGEVTGTFDMDITKDAIEMAAARLRGEIEQTPPMVSAIQVGGKRLHQLAREGKEVERTPRRVTISRLCLKETDDPNVWRCEVECSSGTYIRVIAADLGTILGGGAHLRNLRRTRVGPFGLDDAIPLEQLDHSQLRPVSDAVSLLPALTVDEGTETRVMNGAVLDIGIFGELSCGPWAVFNQSGELLAVYDEHQRGAKPLVVVGRPS